MFCHATLCNVLCVCVCVCVRERELIIVSACVELRIVNPCVRGNRRNVRKGKTKISLTCSK